MKTHQIPTMEHFIVPKAIIRTVQAPEVRFINEAQANSFIQMLNDRSVSQLSFVISASVEQKDSISSSE